MSALCTLDLETVAEHFDENETHERFLAKRQMGIGSSDIADVLGIGDYSCRRRLFLSRLGTILGGSNSHLERGRFFEGPVAKFYGERTGRKLERTGSGYLKEFPFIRANADRIVTRNEDGFLQYGGLEIKCPAGSAFRRVRREGLLDSWILQIQHQMLAYGFKWASVAVMCVEAGIFELEWFDVERDEKICKHIFESAKAAWQEIQQLKTLPLKQALMALPEKRDEYSKACANCPALNDCHGGVAPKDRTQTAERSDLELLVAEFQDNKEEAKGLDARQEELRGAIKDAFTDGVGRVRAGKFTVSITECTREGFDASQCKKDLGNKADKYIKLTTYDRMLVRENK